MSQSRETGKAFDDEDYSFPVDIYPDYFPDEGNAKEKAKQVSEDRNSLSSTPLETGSETEEFGKMTTKPSREGNVDLPFDKLTIHDDEMMKISHNKSGGGSCSSESASQINEYTMTKTTRVGEFQREVHYMFQMELTQSDVESGSLSIPFQTAELHFPSTNYTPIVICDNRNDNWYMTLTYNAGESSALKFFVIAIGWKGLVDCHGLKATDVIRFYKPIPRLHDKHYLIDFVKAQGNVVSPSKNSSMKQGCDEAGQDVILQSKFGGGSCSSERAKQELQDTDDEFDSSVFLFELELGQSDVEQGMLYIPKQTAAKHFPCASTVIPIYEVQIEIFDTQNQNWNMALVYICSFGASFIARGWHRFVIRHNLEAMDVICFYRPLSRLHEWHFLLQHVKRGEAKKDNPPEFNPENFLFELQLTPPSSFVLIIPKEDVINHFPAIEIPRGRTLHFTDAQNKDWSMTIFFADLHDAYMVVGGWEGFVNKHRLQDMDAIRYYKPVRPLHEGHFLIECVKREDDAYETISQSGQLGGAENEGDGGDSWGDRASSASHAGPSPH
ncbi:AP2/ERF and B3 domain-containing transcription factor RAV1 [Camellia lanceoleosa]|uniref:AP2/ERF and B3 domain-containing transcription factor RAV1 n=1 Tax=Camellia lanceoleosa TaxID=1840588 RepID=A0ACC0F7C5_9ERIC|nr:AP2/ERF and B3 domain-containing transcription factor RAV1 [Camellia lanceoleosa]